MTLPFLVSGCLKVADWQDGNAEMLQAGLHPARAFNLATLVTQLGGSALVILNRKVWLGAGALGEFTVLTDFLAHRFWQLIGATAIAELYTFLEHATMAAAFILVIVVGLQGGGERVRRAISRGSDWNRQLGK